jgi:hypothetical protein
MEAVAWALDLAGPGHPTKSRPLAKLLAKMEEASKPRVDTGLGWKRFSEIAREELGEKLAMPESPGAAWYARVSGKLRELGVTEEDARLLSRYVASWRRQSVALEYLANQATVLIAQAKRANVQVTAATGKAYSLFEEDE